QPRRQIARQLIRRDPKDLSNLQTYKPRIEGGSAYWEPQEKDWTYRTRLGKYLQDIYAWDLYEIFSYESNEAGRGESTVDIQDAFRTSMRDIANRKSLAADALLDAGLLEIVVSRDPQKIAEASTGQRWRSCMARDGCNWSYILADIRAGSLIAYVVYKGDAQARYPLMRVLIKPYHQETRSGSRETILVPAKVYGGDGMSSARTCEAFMQTLNGFVSLQNIGKSGKFVMNNRLYADGQVSTVYLQDLWSVGSLHKALADFQEHSIKEWMAEIRRYRHDLVWGIDGKQAAGHIEDYRKLIRRVFDAKNNVVGLPRMFYREIYRSSIGVRPRPEQIVDAVASEGILTERSGAFRALLAGRIDEWDKKTASWTPEFRAFMLHAFCMTVDFKSPEQARRVVWAYAREWMPDAPETSLAGHLRQLRYGTEHKSMHRDQACDVTCLMAERFPKLADVDMAVGLARYVAKSRSGTDSEQADVAMHALKAIAAVNPRPIVDAFNLLRPAVASFSNFAVREAGIYAFGALIQAYPSLADETVMGEIHRIASTDTYKFARTAAYDDLVRIIEVRPDLASEAFLNAITDSSFETIKNSSDYRRSLRLIETIVKVRPELATAELVERLVPKIESQETETAGAALDVLRLLALRQPELADAVPLDKVFELARSGTEVSKYAVDYLDEIIYARPDFADETFVIGMFGVMTSLMGAGRRALASDAWGAIRKVLSDHRDTAEKSVPFLQEAILQKDMSGGVALDAMSTVAHVFPELLPENFLLTMAEAAIASEEAYFLDASIRMLRTVMFGSPSISNPALAKYVQTAALTGETKKARLQGHKMLRVLFLAGADNASEALRDSLIEQAKTDKASNVRQAAVASAYRLTEANPDAVDRTYIEHMADIVLTDSDGDVRREASLALRDVIETYDHLTAPELVGRFLDAVAKNDYSEPYSVIGVICEMHPEYGDRIVKRMFELARWDGAEESSEDKCRALAVNTVLKIVDGCPEVVNADGVKKLVGIALTDPNREIVDDALNILRIVLRWDRTLYVPGLARELVDSVVFDRPVQWDFGGSVKSSAGPVAVSRVLNIVFEEGRAMADRSLFDDVVDLMIEASDEPFDQDRFDRIERVSDAFFSKSPAYADEQFIERMTAIASSDESEPRRLRAVSLLRSGFACNPESADRAALDTMWKLVYDKNATVRGRALYAMVAVAESNPALVDSMLVNFFMNFVETDPDKHTREMALFAFSEVTAKRPDLVTDSMICRIEEIQKHGEYISFIADRALRVIAKTKACQQGSNAEGMRDRNEPETPGRPADGVNWPRVAIDVRAGRSLRGG
ncbi:MAG: hypothetical protein PHE27_05605, partial [Alphaproteobacteria bacterium]|nr:hypothetical protein [Alphaproteobacteria bacterium]